MLSSLLKKCSGAIDVLKIIPEDNNKDNEYERSNLFIC